MAISIVVGWGYILGITFAVTDISYVLSENNDAGGYAIAEIFYLAFKRRYGNGIGGIICLGVVAVGIFFCGMGSVTSNSRCLYLFLIWFTYERDMVSLVTYNALYTGWLMLSLEMEPCHYHHYGIKLTSRRSP